MLEQTYPQNIDIDPTQAIQFTPIEGTQYDPTTFQEHHEAWLSTGECAPPTQIGTMTLSDEAVTHLRDGEQNKFVITNDTQQSFIAEDDIIAADAARRELMAWPLDDKSRELFRGMYQAFAKIIQNDVSNAIMHDPEDTILKSIHVDIGFGMYSGFDPLHIDSDPTPKPSSDIRYLVTIEGPTTQFYSGDGFGPEFFDEDGELQQATPESATPFSLSQGSVVRFLEQGNPHIAPYSEKPVFRIVLTGTARIRPRVQ